MDSQSYSPSTSKSPIIKRSIVIMGHRTSVSQEDAFWIELKRIAAARDMTLGDLLEEIEDRRIHNNHNNLSSAIRLYVLEYLKAELAKAQREAGLIVAL